MEALPEPQEHSRRRRYRRSAGGVLTITANGFELLGYVADYGLISLPQLARLSERSEKSARRLMRALYDSGLVEVVPVCRAALVAESSPSASVLFGSAPNLYKLTRHGGKLLIDEGLREVYKSAPDVGPLAVGLRHFLGANDVRIWLERTVRHNPNHSLVRWSAGQEASLNIHNRIVVKPDSWFIYRIGPAVLVGLLEYDRSTERGSFRWRQKVEGYEALFSAGRLRQLTGYSNARILVIVQDHRRRERLAELLTELAPSGLCSRFWLCDADGIEEPGFDRSVWRVPRRPRLQPLLTDNIADDKS